MSGDAGIERQYWVWVTKPEFYAEADGSDRDDLDPEIAPDFDGWWTCHKATRKGDFVFLYRTAPRKDVAYFIQAASDAYSLVGDELAQERGWQYGCDYQVLRKLSPPVTREQLLAHPTLCAWSPLRQNFQRSVFRVDPADWMRLTRLASEHDRGFARVLEANVDVRTALRIALEEDLEDDLVADLGKLRPFGYDLELFADPVTGRSGRQYVCGGNGGRIDLLCTDRTTGDLVVVELKNVQASRATFGQITSYLGFVNRALADGRRVTGLVISRGSDIQFDDACQLLPDTVRQINLEALGFE
jgi:hypothetical protein